MALGLIGLIIFYAWLVSVGAASEQQNNDSGSLSSAAGCGFYDGFESGGLGSGWTTYTTNEGRVRVSADYPLSGTYGVLLDDGTNNSSYSNAAIILSLDLSGQAEVELDFWWREFGDENHSGDGVFISNDNGVNWHQILSFNNGPSNFRNEVIDIDAAAATNGLTLNDQTQIKFQFYDNFSISSDGYAIDEVRVNCTGSYTIYLPGIMKNWSPPPPPPPPPDANIPCLLIIGQELVGQPLYIYPGCAPSTGVSAKTVWKYGDKGALSGFDHTRRDSQNMIVYQAKIDIQRKSNGQISSYGGEISGEDFPTFTETIVNKYNSSGGLIGADATKIYNGGFQYQMAISRYCPSAIGALTGYKVLYNTQEMTIGICS